MRQRRHTRFTLTAKLTVSVSPPAGIAAFLLALSLFIENPDTQVNVRMWAALLALLGVLAATMLCNREQINDLKTELSEVRQEFDVHLADGRLRAALGQDRDCVVIPFRRRRLRAVPTLRTDDEGVRRNHHERT